MDNKIVALEGGGQPMNPIEQMYSKLDAVDTATREKLDTKIPRDVISKRDAGQGRTLDYLEGWYVIARLNDVFGQGRWSYTTDEMRLVHQGEVDGKFVAHYVSKVTVMAFGTKFSDYGYGDGTDKRNPGKAHELAVKEAVTDGIKRAAKNFGMSMGLALYDKSRENVADEVEVKSEIRAGNPKRAAPNKPEGGQTTVVPTSAVSPNPGSIGASSGTSETQALPKAKDRGELNALISATAKVAVAKKKFADMLGLRTYMVTNFGVDSKEALSDADATTFLNTLNKMINEA